MKITLNLGMVSKIRIAIEDRLPLSMQDELDDHQEEYLSLNYE